MFYPSLAEFIKLSKAGNLIPVCKEIVADMETPVSAFKKVEGEFSFLLESVEGGEQIARYSFMGSNPLLVFRSKGKKIEILKKTGKKYIKSVSEGDPFDRLRELLEQYKAVRVPGIPRFHGGLVGYMGYDTVRFIEEIPDKNKDELRLPDMQFFLTDTILAFDHVKHKIVIISNAHVEDEVSEAYRTAIQKIEALEKKLLKTLKPSEFEIPRVPKREIEAVSNFTKEKYEAMVNKAKEYIRAGDIIQVVPSQRFRIPFKGKAFNIYRVLRTINPSPYMFYLKFKDMQMVGASPEVMVRLDDKEATIRPIAGTKPRGKTKEEDEALAKELLSSEKEKAEHIMLVDLARNDLGRVCDFGSVKVTEDMVIERYSHVMHIVSNVKGEIKPEYDAFDLLKASFPAGTVSGAPKIRAMEIIDELENVKRGPYAGIVGYFSFNKNLDSAITIRTVILKKGMAYVQAGGGVVNDSDPAKEYEESCNKARAMLDAVELSQ